MIEEGEAPCLRIGFLGDIDAMIKRYEGILS
jgi:hypothetical protein